MTRSMTGYATGTGAAGGWTWTWDLRSVNGRGLDLRLRVPDWIEGLEPKIRAALQAAVSRGNVTLSLRIARDEGSDAPVLNPTGLARAVALVRTVEQKAAEGDLGLAPVTAADLLSMRGVLESPGSEADTGDLAAALIADLDGLVARFDAARDAEGAALAAILSGQVDRVETIVAEVRALEPDRAGKMAAALKDALTRVLDNSAGADPDRLAQELAMIGVKADVTEELDRLTAHVEAARALLAGRGPKGRKLDFLSQEFNREANTLCSKSQYAPLTRLGLDLKAVIDQMREQIQNVE